jgi:NADH-quinone oxidoreductase subunit K
MNIGINHFIFLSALMLGLGIYIIVSQRNIIRIFPGIVLVLISPILNFAVFANFHAFNPDGQIMLFVLSAICILLLITGFIIFYNYYEESGSTDLES